MAIADYASLPGIVANADLSSHQYHAVRLTGNKRVTTITDANAAGNAQIPIGILQDDPKSGEPATVAVYGIAKGELGGTVAFGDALSINNTGELVHVDMTTTSVDGFHIGFALEAGADGQIIDVLVHSPTFSANVA